MEYVRKCDLILICRPSLMVKHLNFLMIVEVTQVLTEIFYCSQRMVDTVIIVIFAVNLHSQNYLFILHFVLKLFYHSALLNSPENAKAEKSLL